MPQTSAKGLEVQTTGSNTGTWGTVLNDQMISYVDTFLGGITSLSLASSNTLLTQAQARNVLLRMTGVLLASVSVSPDSGVLLTGFLYFENLTSGSFTVTFTNSAGSVVLPQSRRGILWVDTVNGPRIVAFADSGTADPLPVGTSMLFFNASVPSGWTFDTSFTDRTIRIVNSTGGSTGGVIPFGTLFNRTATDDHTLTTNEIPSHRHSIPGAITTGSGFGGTGTPTLAQTTTNTDLTGGGAGHSHNIDMRVTYVETIVGIKQ